MTRIDRNTPPAVGQPAAPPAPVVAAPEPQVDQAGAATPQAAVTLSASLRARLEQPDSDDATAGVADVDAIRSAPASAAAAAHSTLDPARVLNLLSD